MRRAGNAFFFMLVAVVLQAAALALAMPVAGPQRGVYDAEIQRRLEQALRKDEKFRHVQGRAEDHRVTLSGSVKLYRHRLDAEAIARRIEHVQGVDNDIVVRGKRVPDAELRERLASRLRYDRSGQGNVFNALELGVADGFVTLKGHVRTDSDRDSALALVAGTEGVRGLQAEISVAPASIMDDELRVRIVNHLYRDPVLQKYAADPQAPIRVVVEHGRVVLYGTVNSRMDKDVAGMRAREVSGSFSVENRIEVGQNEARK
jgi:hyperosmotically inducible protein